MSVVRRFFRILARLAATLVLAGIPALLLYLQLVGFNADWRAEVAKALGGPTFTVEIGRLTFRPFEGIVAEDAVMRRRDNPSAQLARIDRLVVSPNLAHLLRGKISIDQLDLENASVSIPFTEDGAQPDTIKLSGIRASILNGNGQLTISRAECWFDGIHISVTGHLLNPETAAANHTPSTPAHVMQRTNVLRSVLQTLERLEFSGASPRLAVDLRGDLLEPVSISADRITLQTGGVRFDDLHFDRVELSATFADRVLHVQKLHAAGRDGAMLIGGEWNFADNSGYFDLNGGLMWAPLLLLAGRADLAKQIAFDTPPLFNASVTAEPGMVFSAIGQVSTQGFRLKGLKARSFTSSFAWKGGQLYVQDAVLQSSTGTVRADILSGPGSLKIALDSEAVPNEFREFFGPKEQAIIDLLKFDDVPKLHVTLTGTRPSLDALSGVGRIELGRAAMRDSWIDFAKADLEVKDRSIIYKNLTIGKGKLRATGSFTYDFGQHEVRLDGVRSNINPPDVLMWVDPRVAATVAVYRFLTPPDVRADGIAHMEDPTKNDLRVELDAPGGLKYSLLNRDLVFGATKATVLLKGQHVLADVQRAQLYGGQVAVNANVSTDPGDPTFSADVTAERVDFPSLTKLYFGYAKSEGVMSGKYDFTADLRNPSAMRGSGSIRVEDGQVLAIPLFGPLSVIISTIIPGAGHESARLATLDFTIAEQLMHTKNLEIQGAGFELFGDGNVGFPSGKLDLTVRINAKGLPGIVLFPVSKLFEYVSTGTMSDPQWLPKIIPKEFFNVLGFGGGAKPPADAH